MILAHVSVLSADDQKLLRGFTKTRTIILESLVADPFENENVSYFVLVNHLGQHSLWPDAIDVPSGWQVVFHSSRRQECLDYVAANWTDMLPGSRSAQVNAP